MNTLNEKFSQPQGAGAHSDGGVFLRNLEMIRPAAWAIAAVAIIGLWCVFWFAVIPSDPKMSEMPAVLRALIALAPGIVLAAYVLLIGFVYVDAKRRGMRYVMWTLVSIFVPNAFGIILYFILRDSLPSPCPKCNYLARGGFTFCPNCGAELLRACRMCHKKIELGWTNCAYCGSPIASQVQKQPTS